MKRALLAALTVVVLAARPSTQQAPAPSAQDPLRTPIMQNDTVALTHLRFRPGSRETVHTHPFPLLLIQLSAGDLDVKARDVVKRGTHAGEVWYVATNESHAVMTVASATATVDVLAIALLPSRIKAAAAPVTEAPPGVTRTTLIDNVDVRVARVRFDPGSKEPLHSHPFDLLTVQLTPGNLDLVDGSEHTTGTREPGFIKFLQRSVQHAYASLDSKAFEMLSISVK